MRVAVIGGTGLTGRHTVEALKRLGHDVVIVSRSHGVDILTNEGLDAALAGAAAVIDVTSFEGADFDTVRATFAKGTSNLLAAEQRAGVRHHILLSIVNVDTIKGNPHYAGKRAQEELVSGGPIPFTIQRATQFYEFPEMVVSWNRKGDVAVVPPLLMQPVAVADVGTVLAELAQGSPLGRAPDLAGPETQDLVDMVRRIFAARGQTIHLVPSWRGGSIGVDSAGEVLLPGPDARIAPMTFDAWLERIRDR